MMPPTKTIRRRPLRSSAPRQPSDGERSPSYRGIPLSARPDDTVPQIPLNISDVNDEELMNLYARYVAWANYITTLLAEAEIEEANAATEWKVSQAEALVASWGGTKEERVTVAKAERELDPDVRAQEERYNNSRAHRKMLSTLADNMDRASALVSRELTRRLGRDTMDRRLSGWRP